VEMLGKRKFAGDTEGLMQEFTRYKIQVLINAAVSMGRRNTKLKV